MMLGELIDELAKHDPAKRVPDGFARPHSYRGYYECLAFEPAKGVTVGTMLEAATAADGATYQGYKGGDFRMGRYTDVYLAEYGDTGEPLGMASLRAMLNPVEDAVRAAVAAERERCAGVAEATEVEGCYRQGEDGGSVWDSGAEATKAEIARRIRRGPEPTEGV